MSSILFPLKAILLYNSSSVLDFVGSWYLSSAALWTCIGVGVCACVFPAVPIASPNAARYLAYLFSSSSWFSWIYSISRFGSFCARNSMKFFMIIFMFGS